MKLNRFSLGLLAACAALAGCTDGSKTQVVTGQVTADAIAVRAVDGNQVVTAAQVRSDGSFTLALPSGNRYRIEVLTKTGVKQLYQHQTTGLHALTFEVCKPAAPWDVGRVKPPAGGPNDSCDPTTDPNCKCDPAGNCGTGCTDPNDPSCGGGGGGTGCDPLTDPNCHCDAAGFCGTGCDPTTDPTCKCDPAGNCSGGGGGCTDPNDPNCGGGGCTDPNDPNCGGGGCTDPNDPNCGGGGGGGCDPATDPTCKCGPDGTCSGGGGGCTDPNDPSCGGGGTGCDPTTNPYCKCDPSGICVAWCDDPTGQNCPPPPPPPCDDPTDPNQCKDECANDPATCGCAAGDPSCWGDPNAPKCDASGTCSADGALMPDHPPGDFGCP